jgi:lysosomal acid lipase/cholesteryl ester hydrolase
MSCLWQLVALVLRIIWRIFQSLSRPFKAFFFILVEKLPWLWDQIYFRSTLLQQIFSYRLGQYNLSTIDTAASLCQISGISLETHRTITPDGFEIILHRCSLQKDDNASPLASSSSSTRPPVLLVHGLMQDAESFLCGGSSSLVFSLVHAGYDVWIGNNRGTKYSSSHVSYERAQRDYWDYSIDDLATYDVPTLIHYILAITSYSQLAYVGFSQGSVQGYISLSLYPSLHSKISTFIALSPAFKTSGLSSSWIQFFLHLFPSLTFTLFGHCDMLACCLFFRQILSKNFFAHIISYALRFLFHWSCQNISSQRRVELFQYCYSSSSVKCVDHWFQIIQSGSLKNYSSQSLGRSSETVSSQEKSADTAEESTETAEESAETAEESTVRRYHISSGNMPRINCPLAVFYGGRDTLIVGNIHEVLADLQDSISYQHCEPSYEHLDMIWADNAHQQIFPKIIEQLRRNPSTNQLSDEATG